MSVIHAPKGPGIDARTLVFPIGLGAALATLFFRLWYFQVVHSEEFSSKAEESRFTQVEKLAPRGLIYDRQGKLIAGVQPQIVITAIPTIVNQDQNDWVIDKVVSLLGGKTTRDRIEAKLNEGRWRPYLPCPIYVGAPIEVGTKIAESGDAMPGIGVETQPTRYYPDPVSLSHVLGRVGVPDKSDLERLEELDLEPAAFVGKGGIEKAYEESLMGVPGFDRVEVDSKRRPVRDTTPNKAIPGDQLHLTIDVELQQYALDLLKMHGHIGAIVAIDPKTGEVLCLASNPSYNQSTFSADYATLRQDPSKPMVNRAIASAYAPGSTFKIVTSLAAFETNHFDESDTYFCAGGMEVGNTFKKCLGHHGQIGYHEAFKKSCNTYFFNLGKLAGPDALRKASAEFGLGQHSGIELGADSKGVIPTPDYLKKVRKPPKWYFGDTLNFCIGQGFVNTTPIQMANVAAQVANDGVRFRPHLVREITNLNDASESRKIEPEVVSRISASPEFWRVLKSALQGVVDDGTAKAARMNDVNVAGKTGSAEHEHGTKTHAWFVGFAPVESPQIAFTVFLEEAGHGGDIAAPIAKEFLEHYFNVTLKAAAKRSASAAAASASATAPVAR